MKPGARLLEEMIVAACEGNPRTAEGIAALVLRSNPDRWVEGTVRTAVSRVAEDGRIVVVGEGRTSRGMKARLYRAVAS